MLRRIFLLLTVIVVNTCYVFPQIEIDYSDFANVGDGYVYAVKTFKEGQMTISKLDSLKWDISSFKPDTYDTVRFYPKHRSRYGNLFPNAEVLKFQTKKNMEFLTIDSSKVKMHGIINDYLGLKAAVVLVFPTELAVYKFPLKKGKVLNDSISKNFVSSYGLKQFADSIRIDLDMSNYSVFDTSGFVKTPTDGYETLREKNTVYKKMIAYKNSHLTGWVPAREFSSTTKTVYYRWFAKKNGIAVMEAEGDEKGNITAIRYQHRQPMQVSIEKTDVNCKGKNTGSLFVNVSGGTPDYKFVWSHGKKGRKLDSLKAGVYTVEVTDCKGERRTQSVEIKEPDEELILKINFKDITCYGANDAVLKADVKGGTKPYYIVWSDDTEADEITKKGSGIYGCIVRDARRCFSWDSVEITQPETSLTFSPRVEHSQCSGQAKGKIFFEVSGGEKPYKYFLNDEETTDTVGELFAGVYQTKVVDKRGCELVRKAEVRQPDKPLEADGDVKNVTCSGGSNGSISLKVSGGTSGYKYFWSNDAQSRDVSNLSPGVYKVKITDSKDCSIEKSFIVNAPSSVLKIECTVSDVTVKGGSDGSIKVKGLGGVGPYTVTCNNKNDFKNLKAGNYDIRLSDKNNCTVIETVIVSEPEE
ncbi:MAG: SprB repeat-containing protein [Bacteroidales bacterium]|nr:SprB repeat-containing protein [Bacteroidales bacterium]